MVFSAYTKLRILYLWQLSYKPATISEILQGEGITVSSRGVVKFLQRYLQTGSAIHHKLPNLLYHFAFKLRKFSLRYNRKTCLKYINYIPTSFQNEIQCFVLLL